MGTVVPPLGPAALLAGVLARCAHPTTLVVCAASDAFVQRCAEDDVGGRPTTTTTTTTSLRAVAVARHIRVLFAPTVAHLRAALAALDPGASRVPPPPVVGDPDFPDSPDSHDSPDSLDPLDPPHNAPTLLVYGLLQLHRGTSEWSAQGLGATAAVLAEAGWRTGLAVVLAEDSSRGAAAADEAVPVLSTAPRRLLQRAGYPRPTVRVRAVLARWFTEGEWIGEGENKTRTTNE